MKNIFIILVLLFVSSFLSGCSNSVSPNGSSSPENSNSTSGIIQPALQTPSQNNSSTTEAFNTYSQGVYINQTDLKLEQIAKMVFENQMNYVEQPNCPDDRRIKDYKISTIKIEEIRDSGFIFSVNYSVLPATDKFVLAGNGTIGNNGWMNDKYHFVDVSIDNGTYKIVSMATGK